MSLLDFFTSILGSDSRYQFFTYIVASGMGLVFIDAIFRFIFGSVSSLFYRK